MKYPARRTLWNLYQCDNGARWSAVHGGPYAEENGSPCQFSGCPAGHFIHLEGKTDNLHTAAEWFRRPASAAMEAEMRVLGVEDPL